MRKILTAIRDNVGNIERIIVVAAAIAAAFPLWQWYMETDDRRLDRLASLITAAESCTNLSDESLMQIYTNGKMFIFENNVEIEVPPMPPAAYDPRRAAKLLCFEIALNLISDRRWHDYNVQRKQP